MLCGIFRLRASADFYNIAVGSHRGNITMKAASAVGGRNLILAMGAEDGSVKVAELGDKPFAVSADCAEAGELLGVTLPGCTDSTLLCVAAEAINFGSTVYSRQGGKVGMTAKEGSFKIGVALCSAASGQTVEVDPEGFGSTVYEVVAFGSTDWDLESTMMRIDLDCIKLGDPILAYVQKSANGESVIASEIQENQFTVTLDKNGTPGVTKITWLVLRKN